MSDGRFNALVAGWCAGCGVAMIVAHGSEWMVIADFLLAGANLMAAFWRD